MVARARGVRFSIGCDKELYKELIVATGIDQTNAALEAVMEWLGFQTTGCYIEALEKERELIFKRARS